MSEAPKSTRRCRLTNWPKPSRPAAPSMGTSAGFGSTAPRAAKPGRACRTARSSSATPRPASCTAASSPPCSTRAAAWPSSSRSTAPRDRHARPAHRLPEACNAGPRHQSAFGLLPRHPLDRLRARDGLSGIRRRSGRHRNGLLHDWREPHQHAEGPGDGAIARCRCSKRRRIRPARSRKARSRAVSASASARMARW